MKIAETAVAPNAKEPKLINKNYRSAHYIAPEWFLAFVVVLYAATITFGGLYLLGGK